MGRKFIKKIVDLKEIIIIVLAVITFAWCKLAIPEIDRRVDVKIIPVVDALEFQNFLMMESLPDSVVTRAIERYTNTKKGSVKK